MMIRHARSTLVFLFDLLAAVAAWVGGFVLRFNLEWPDHYAEKMLITGTALVVVHGVDAGRPIRPASRAGAAWR